MSTDDIVELLVEPEQIIELIVEGPQGPPGDTLVAPAAAAVSGHRVMAWQADAVRHADAAAIGDAARIVGVSLNAAALGDNVSIRTMGRVTDASLSLTPGLPVYLGAAGAFTQTPPASPAAAFLLRIGEALSADTLFVRIATPISL